MTPLDITCVPLFASLPADAQQEIAASLRQISLAPGAILIGEGDPGDSFCIILEGEIEVIKAAGTEDERLLRVQGAGSFVGEMSLFERKGRRTATVRARTNVEAAAMMLADFDALLHRQPALAYEVMRVMSLRLRDADNATIRDLHQKNQQLEQAYAALQEAQAQLVDKAKLEHELQMARAIQQSILPQQLPDLPGYDFGALIAPAQAVGGDFYDFIPLGSGSLGIVVADISDKGLPAAIFMALTRSLVRAEALRGVFPAEVLRRVNRHLLDMNDAGMFVTVLYGILHARTGQFLYARAGHELPVVAGPTGDILAVPSESGQILGLLPDPVLDEEAISLPKGGKLVLFTDGVTDAMDEEGEAFGRERLCATVAVHAAGPAQAVCDGVMQAVLLHQGAAAQFDDFTMVVASAI